MKKKTHTRIRKLSKKKVGKIVPNKIIVDFHSHLLIYIWKLRHCFRALKKNVLAYSISVEFRALDAIKWRKWHTHIDFLNDYHPKKKMNWNFANLHIVFFSLSRSLLIYVSLYEFILPSWLLDDLIGANVNASLLSIWESHTSLDDNWNTSSTTKTM